MIRILFVDDDPDILELAQIMFELRKPEWEVETCNDPLSAIELIDKKDFDAVVSDFQMETMNGDDFLKTVATCRPLSVRIMSSSQVSVAREVQALGIAHRFVAKGADFKELIQTIERACALRTRIVVPELQALLNNVTDLPSPPRHYFALRELLCREDFHQGKLIDLIGSNMSLCTQILKASNSAYYGARTQITSLERAVTLLGVNTIKTIVLAAELFSQLDDKKVKKFAVDELWEHSVLVANVAASITDRSPDTRMLRDSAYTGGLLHDIGKLICIHAFPEKYEEALKLREEEDVAMYEAEMELYGVSHQEIGGYLLALWGIPDQIVEAVVYHHQPLLCSSREVSVLTFVAAANIMARNEELLGAYSDEQEVEDYLCAVGAASELIDWEELGVSQDS